MLPVYPAAKLLEMTSVLLKAMVRELGNAILKLCFPE